MDRITPFDGIHLFLELIFHSDPQEILIKTEDRDNEILKNITEESLVFQFHLIGEKLEAENDDSDFDLNMKFDKFYSDICNDFYCVQNFTDDELTANLVPHHKYILNLTAKLETTANEKKYYANQILNFVSDGKPPIFVPSVLNHGYYIDEYEKVLTIYWKPLPKWKYFSRPQEFYYLLEIWDPNEM